MFDIIISYSLGLEAQINFSLLFFSVPCAEQNKTITGYFRPEDCDDIAIPCAYHPLPNFENLRQAYTTLIVDPNVTSMALNVTDFVIPTSRRHHSICPSEFPTLSEFVWDADRVPDLSCPNPKYMPKLFVCPANLDDLRPKAHVIPNIVTTPLYLITAVVAILALMLGLGLSSWFWMHRTRRGDDMSPNMDDNGKLPWSTIVVIPKLRRSEDDTASSESVGLLSMTDLLKGDYQAIESDASSEEN